MDLIEDADRLRYNSIQKSIINDYIMSILRNISDNIKDAYRCGMHDIDIKLPILFVVEHMANSDSQRAVISGVLDVLLRKKYKVELNLSKTECQMKISWMRKEDLDVIEAQNKMIASCLRSS